MLLRLPVLGETVRYAIVERYCRILSSMVSAGVPLTEAMTVARESIRNLVFDQGLRQAYDEMVRGAGLAGPLLATKLFPATASQMIRVGEETGSLDTQLEVAAQYFERELDYKIKKVTSLIEPAVLLFSGAHGRVRRHRARLGDVRHLPNGEPGMRVRGAFARGEAGESLLEIIITIMIMGLAIPAVVGAVLAAVGSSSQDRRQVQAQQLLTSWSETIAKHNDDGSYAACPATSYYATGTFRPGRRPRWLRRLGRVHRLLGRRHKHVRRMCGGQGHTPAPAARQC